MLVCTRMCTHAHTCNMHALAHAHMHTFVRPCTAHSCSTLALSVNNQQIWCGAPPFFGDFGDLFERVLLVA